MTISKKENYFEHRNEEHRWLVSGAAVALLLNMLQRINITKKHTLTKIECTV